MDNSHTEGPFKPGVTFIGNFAPTAKEPEAWFYRNKNGGAEIHLQVRDGLVMAHYRIVIPAKRKKN